MQTQDVLARLKRATTDRVPSPTGKDRGRANSRLVGDDRCQNCGRDHGEATVDRRRLGPTESPEDGNEVTLCDAADVPPTDAQATADGSVDACTHAARVVDADAVLARDANRCRGCAVRERIVVGSGPHVHPVVPVDATGYRHAHDFVGLCPLCHRALHDRIHGHRSAHPRRGIRRSSRRRRHRRSRPLGRGLRPARSGAAGAPATATRRLRPRRASTDILGRATMRRA